MTEAIFPSFFFPNIQYFQALSRFESISIEAKETFPKQTQRNRCYVLSANGKMSINVPLARHVDSLHHKTTDSIAISYSDNWNIKAWRTIQSSYGKSPYFEYYETDIRQFFTKKYDKLIDLNQEILAYFLKRFNIKTNISLSQDYIKDINPQSDFRTLFDLYMKNKNQDPAIFNKYIQCFSEKHGFVENLSCLDLLFNTGPESRSFLI